MTGVIRGINCFPEKKHPGLPLRSVALLADAGMEGDVHQGGNKQLCLLAIETRQWMDSQEIQGLCFYRFKENILTGQLSFEDLAIGQNLQIGESTITISAFKNPCYEQCQRVAGKLECKLHKGACFAVVKEGGAIAVGDKIVVLP